MKNLLNLLRNKFFLSGIAFLVWMFFFDRNDAASQYEYRNKVNKLEEEKDFYNKEIAKADKELKELTTNVQSLEKFARERYLMKKENEDIFVVVDNKKEDQ
ncbi:septum formation initiator [Pedobacter psychrophilus]|uniref:Septum formation initiator n=1 Tax=Pedobacter psychrophilus TaxID=1826909 RepID=A0A179DJ75_9SPHI|nr:septum formation initiator family protein [Pedobacter psychrophilus]OAQ40589.1 septum formation initiator [Pedobacter psychrophilus]